MKRLMECTFLIVFGLAFLSSVAFAEETLPFTQQGSSPEQAQIFLIGELHTVPIDAVRKVEVLKKFARAGDILLLEGDGFPLTPAKAVPILDPNLLKTAVSLKLQVAGWDDRKAFLKTVDSLGESELLEKVFNSSTASGSEKASALARASLVALGRYRLMLKRNRQMRQVLATYSSQFPSARIFVIAGEDHLKSALLNLKLKSIDRLYVILLPIDGDPLRVKTMDGAEYTHRLVQSQKPEIRRN